jgi:putative membrane protein
MTSYDDGGTPYRLMRVADCALAAAFILLLGFGANAQEGKGGDKVAKADRDFVMQAADGNLAEVALGQLAVDSGSSDEVKKFGQRMIDDHGKSYKELSEIATKQGIAVPKEPSAKKQSETKKFAKLKGDEFDRHFAEHMVADHEKTIALFKQAAGKAQSEEIKAYATKTLPTLQEHLKLARALPGQKKK